MGTSNPPAGWSVSAATWGTDIDRSETVLDGGSYSVHFLDTTPGGLPELRSDLVQAVPDRAYKISARVRADDVSSGNTMHVGMRFYDADLAYLSPGDFDIRELDAVDTWQWLSAIDTAPSGAAYIQLVVGKDGAASFNAYVAQVDWSDVPGYFEVNRTADQTSVASGDVVILNNVNAGYSDIDWSFDTSTGVATLHRGLWHINGSVHVVVSDGQSIWSVLHRSGGTEYPGAFMVAGAASSVTLPVSAIIEGPAEVDLRVRWSGGGTKTVWRNDGDSVIQTRLEGIMLTKP